MPKDPQLLAHQQWLGYLQPVGLVVSPPALVQAQAFVNSNVAAEQAQFLEHVQTVNAGSDEPVPAITDLKGLLTDPVLFAWKDTDLVADEAKVRDLEVVLIDYHETLRPSFAVPAPDGGWLLLVQELPLATDMDEIAADTKHWQASPQDRFVRLLRGAKVPIGLLSNGVAVRLVYAPGGHEASGHITFPVAALSEVAGRPALAALLMLLGAERLFTLPDKQRLPALLEQSRKYQNTVSTELAEQVLAALFELLRGFQAADDQRKGDLLRDVLAHEPDQVYAGLVTVLMRSVFLLYAEQKGLMSDADVYVRYYSVSGLFERLREDAGRYPDTMDQRYGAWAHLLAVFRLTYDGGRHIKLNRRTGRQEGFELKARHGYLFDADRYPFLEGRARGSQRRKGERINPPLVSDGVVFRVLHNLLLLDGDRISYGTLNVEHIGSVYESIMGYRLEKAGGRSIALRPKKSGGAPVTVNLEALLAQKAGDRAKWLSENADQKVDGKALTLLKAADTVEGLVAALEKRIARALTPNIVPPGGMILQPSEERRRSGSHYTPPTLTGPVVRKALEPVLAQLGNNPTPDQILALKVCDPAMGSGAFLVEVCRQLAEALLRAWVAHGQMPKVPEDETPELLAQRTVAQRCLYGVDKNRMAVDLAKLSLWLATLAKDHPFTFLDHNLKDGDSLVGLTLRQVRTCHWKPAEKEQMVLGQSELVRRVTEALHYRHLILDSDESTPHEIKEQNLRVANEQLNTVRFAGNLVVAAFFSAEKDKKRNEQREAYKSALGAYFEHPEKVNLRPNKEERALREGAHPVEPFHWEIEFPEVFQGTEGSAARGFDCIVGNPPFAGKNTIGDGNRDGYLDWLKTIHEESHGNADLVAHFFRRAFGLLRPGGTFGLIATNTIAQGDTRSSGLRWICTNGGTIYHARRRYKWPGLAAVVVSVVHVVKGATHDLLHPKQARCELDGKLVERITAYLFHAGGHNDPVRLAANAGKNFTGASIYGPGFTFDDTDNSGAANPISLMNELIEKDGRNDARIFPYIGGEEVNDSPTHAFHRYVINFGEMTEDQARKWPDLMKVVEEKVKPERKTSINKDVAKWPWWQFWRIRGELTEATRGMKHVIGISRVGEKMAFTLLPANIVFADSLVLLTFDTAAALCVLQSRIHEIWARFFASSMKDDLRYTPSDCFETFPFPSNFESSPELEAAGKAYYEFRADLMVRNDEGLTKTYNRFHDPNETSADIITLRELHAAMDRAVLDAYGGDLAALTVPPCEFLLDYEDEEDEDEPTSGRQRKKPWRYRWPDAFRDEVLALLLDLNKKRAEEEKLTALPKAKGKKPTRKKPAAQDDMLPKQVSLFDLIEQESDPESPTTGPESKLEPHGEITPFPAFKGAIRCTTGDVGADGTKDVDFSAPPAEASSPTPALPPQPGSWFDFTLPEGADSFSDIESPPPPSTSDPEMGTAAPLPPKPESVRGAKNSFEFTLSDPDMELPAVPAAPAHPPRASDPTPVASAPTDPADVFGDLSGVKPVQPVSDWLDSDAIIEKTEGVALTPSSDIFGGNVPDAIPLDSSDLLADPVASEPEDIDSIFSELIDQRPSQPGDSSGIRLESPGTGRTLEGSPNDQFDITMLDEPVPADLEAASGTAGDEPTNWDQLSGSDLFAERHTAPEIDWADAGQVNSVDADLGPDDPSLTSDPQSIFAGEKGGDGSTSPVGTGNARIGAPSDQNLTTQYDPARPTALSPERANDLVPLAAPLPHQRNRREGEPEAPPKTAVCDQVECAVFAPPEVARGKSLLVQVFAFEFGRGSEAAKLATEFDASATRRAVVTLSALVRRGDAIRFQLRMPFPTEPPEAALVWTGTTASVQFEVAVPKAHPTGDVFGTVLVTVADVPVGQVKFKLTVTTARKKAKENPALAADHRPTRFRRAFVSYSSRDREVVERAVGLLSLTGIDYFQDVRDLAPGEPWRPQLEEAIDSCDLFLLFWSSNARASEEVGREIARAIARLGPTGDPPPVIWPYVIEGPPGPPPPNELAGLHFGNFHYLRPRGTL